jgi:hypothetical protein
MMLTGALDENDRIAMALVVMEARDQMVKGGGEAHGSFSPVLSVVCRQSSALSVVILSTNNHY